MQTTLDIVPSTSNVEVTPRNSTLMMSEEHIEYLYRNFCPSYLEEEQINDYILHKKAEEENLKEEFEYLSQFEGFKPKRKHQKYIRVGKHDDF